MVGPSKEWQSFTSHRQFRHDSKVPNTIANSVEYLWARCSLLVSGPIFRLLSEVQNARKSWITLCNDLIIS
jgi:hypothetical protein